MPDPADLATALEIETLAGVKPTASQKLRETAALIAKADTLRAYRRLFLDPRTGELKPDAVKVLADLGHAAGLGKAYGYGADAAQLNAREGKRALLLHLFARLGRGKLHRIAQRMRDKTNG
jgi:hypothetical protein